MKQIPSFLKVYGDLDFRGDCPPEDAHLVTFFNQINKKYPGTYHLIAFHPKNEGKKTYLQAQADKSKGQKAGVSDIIVVGNPALVIELKRMDHTKSKFEDGQLQFLEMAHNAGAMVCLAFGHEAALQAFEDWRKIVENRFDS